MRRVILAGLLLLSTGCFWRNDPPPEQNISTGATVIYSGGTKGSEVFSICDKTDRIIMTRTNPQIAVVKDGCNPNVGGPGGPSPLAVGVASDKINLPALPQPFLIQLVPPPTAVQLPALAPPSAAVKDAEAIPPIIINVYPSGGGPPEVIVPKPAPKAGAPKKSCPC